MIFGCKESPKSPKDYLVGNLLAAVEYPSSFFFHRVPVHNQLQYPFCVGNGLERMKYHQEKDNYPSLNYNFSRLGIYKRCKELDGNPNADGTYIKVGLKVLQEEGIGLEKTYPYSLASTLPPIPSEYFKEAESFKISHYALANTIPEIKSALLAGSPAPTGVYVTSAFMDEKDGFVGMPNGKFMGGHCVVIDGWDDNLSHTYKNGKTLTGFFRFINSWGDSWGDKGYGYLPFDYFTFRDENGMSFFMEAWASLDLILPAPPIKKVEMWIGKEIVLVDGQETSLDVYPTLLKTIDNSGWRTVIPVRFLTEILGCKVDWDEPEKKITITVG